MCSSNTQYHFWMFSNGCFEASHPRIRRPQKEQQVEWFLLPSAIWGWNRNWWNLLWRSTRFDYAVGWTSEQNNSDQKLPCNYYWHVFTSLNFLIWLIFTLTNINLFVSAPVPVQSHGWPTAPYRHFFLTAKCNINQTCPTWTWACQCLSMHQPQKVSYQLIRSGVNNQSIDIN